MAAPNETVALHIGYVRSQDNTDLITSLEDTEGVAKVVDDGDDWTEWGEKNPARAHGHLVVLITGNSPIGIQNLGKELGQRYGKVICEDHYGCTWVVTTAEDYSDTYSSSGRVKKAA